MPQQRPDLPTRADARISAAVAAVLELAPDEQRRAYAELSEYLGSAAADESTYERIARQRLEALHDLGMVAQHLGLPSGGAPTQQQYTALLAELGLRHKASAVAELWNGRWRQATDHYLGRGRYENEAMTALRVRAQAAARTVQEDREAWALHGIRTWLDDEPPPINEHLMTYRRWARARNAAGADPPFYSDLAVRNNLGIRLAGRGSRWPRVS